MNKSYLTLSFILALASCGTDQTNSKFPNQIIRMRYLVEEDMAINILQIGNLRWNTLTDFEQEQKKLKFLIQTTNPELLVINGDTFYKADSSITDKVLNVFDSLNVHYILLLGEEDYLSNININYLTKYNKNFFIEKSNQQKDVICRITLTYFKKSGDELAYLYFINSTGYVYENSILKLKSITSTQIEDENKSINEKWRIAPKFIFTHIPTTNFSQNYSEDKLIIGKKNSSIYCDDTIEDSSLISDKMLKDINTRGVFASHDLDNDYAFYSNDILYANCPNYNQKDHSFSASLLKLNTDFSFSYSNIYFDKTSDKRIKYDMKIEETPTYKTEYIML